MRKSLPKNDAQGYSFVGAGSAVIAAGVTIGVNRAPSLSGTGMLVFIPATLQQNA